MRIATVERLDFSKEHETDETYITLTDICFCALFSCTSSLLLEEMERFKLASENEMSAL
jgi:hypothetical protein